MVVLIVFVVFVVVAVVLDCLRVTAAALIVSALSAVVVFVDNECQCVSLNGRYSPFLVLRGGTADGVF